jgi:4-hydroxyphenylpyruvate dioxygenase
MLTSIATVSISGDLPGKLAAIAAAGFDGFELFEADFTASSIGPEQLRSQIADLGLKLFALQPFRDFEGMLDAARGAAFSRAERKFDLMERLGTDLLLVPSNCAPQASDGVGRAAADLRELGERAAKRGFRIGFEALAWGRHVRDWTAAWEIVQRADHPAVGLVLDTYHLFVRGNPISPIRDVPVEKIAIVQLADAPSLDMEVLRHSRHLRNFPGQGDYPVTDVIAELLSIGYDGVLSHEIFNDDFRTAPALQTATDGYRSMMWLEEQLVARAARPTLLTSSVSAAPRWTDAPRPMPTTELVGFAFVEFVVPTNAARTELHAFLCGLGFRQSHRHRTKAVDLFELGGTWIAVVAEPESYTQALADTRRTTVSGIGLIATDAQAGRARAEAYQCTTVARHRGSNEAEIPAITGVGGTLIYLVDATSPHFTETDFVPTALDPSQKGEVAASVTTPWLRIDHVAQAVAPYELLSAMLFYRAVLGLELQPPLEFADLNGLVTSRTVVSANGCIRIPLNTAAGAESSPERFRSTAHGSGVQHIALVADDLQRVLDVLDPAMVLTIPTNYYEDLVARFDLSPQDVAELARRNLLYDRNESGVYLHLYTEEIHGVFFEFVQRVGYSGFGAANAPIRLAAQASQRVRN